MNLLNAEFKRKFSVSLYKNLKLNLAEMSFYKDFVNDKRGDLYPVIKRTDGADESVCQNIYRVGKGLIERLFCEFFPYATYELCAKIHGGSFVKIDGEQYFICGNDFNAVSDYRIYHKGGRKVPNSTIPTADFAAGER